MNDMPLEAPQVNQPGEQSTFLRAEHGGSVNNIKIDLGGTTILIMSILAMVIGACGLVMGLNLSRQKEMQDHYDDLRRQYRMVELKLDDWTVVAHRSGLMLPDDYARGPQGNPDKKSFEPNNLGPH